MEISASKAWLSHKRGSWTWPLSYLHTVGMGLGKEALAWWASKDNLHSLKDNALTKTSCLNTTWMKTTRCSTTISEIKSAWIKRHQAVCINCIHLVTHISPPRLPKTHRTTCSLVIMVKVGFKAVVLLRGNYRSISRTRYFSRQVSSNNKIKYQVNPRNHCCLVSRNRCQHSRCERTRIMRLFCLPLLSSFR